MLEAGMKSKLYVSAVAEARRLLGRKLKSASVVEHLLHDNRFHVLFPSMDARTRRCLASSGN